MAQKELPWIAEARKHIGLSEIPGKNHNPVIRNWLISLKAWWQDDETPWCGTFAAHCCRQGGRDVPQHWYRARAWADAGTRLSRPVYGCLAVFSREGGGHVGEGVGNAVRCFKHYDGISRRLPCGEQFAAFGGFRRQKTICWYSAAIRATRLRLPPSPAAACWLMCGRLKTA